MDKLPSISDRLLTLKPSSEILLFYRNRLAQYEKEQQDLSERLSSFESTCDKQFQMERELRQKDEELGKLRTALSDIQACLFQEREHVLRLYSENDRLKIRELEDRKKIQKLLALCASRFPNADLAYILNVKPGLFPQKNVLNKDPVRKSNNGHTGSTVFLNAEDEHQKSDPEILHLQIEALRAELEEKTKLAREHIEALTEDCNVTREEAESQRLADLEKINKLSTRLKKCQDLLQQGLRDYTTKQGEMRAHEQELLLQRDQLFLELEKVSRNGSDFQYFPSAVTKGGNHSQSHIVPTASQPSRSQAVISDTSEAVVSGPSTVTISKVKSETEILKGQLNRARSLSEVYQKQCLKLEEELAKLREERDASKDILKERSGKLTNQLHTLTTRHRDLERRHRLEVEGFRNDIKFLRTQMQRVEKQLIKAAIVMNQDEQDKMVLEAIHRNTKRSKLLSDQLRAIKMDIFNLEQDLQHL